MPTANHWISNPSSCERNSLLNIDQLHFEHERRSSGDLRTHGAVAVGKTCKEVVSIHGVWECMHQGTKYR